MGLRPLILGQLADESGYVLASETVALDGIANVIREVKPGEGIKISQSSYESFYHDPRQNSASCIFELIYLAHPKSEVFGIKVAEFRKKCGAELAKTDIRLGLKPDVIVPVVESGRLSAEGYSIQMQELLVQQGTPLHETENLVPQLGLVKNQHFLDRRIFIAPGNRASLADGKFSADPAVVRDKEVVIVDDSIVRGDTMRCIVKKLYNAGARRVHVRIAAPPIRHPCFMGVDFPDSSELIAYNRNEEEIRKQIDADSLCYLTLDTLQSIAETLNPNLKFCKACFSGKYPFLVNQKELFLKQGS